jgi:hypothetical protein
MHTYMVSTQMNSGQDKPHKLALQSEPSPENPLSNCTSYELPNPERVLRFAWQ